ncbi:MAG: aminopeptidase P family protein [Gemmatimonadales bacterium]|nr:MAG: aminopeptidase P family protein [Gemmatimonadales bacterium]
MSPTSPRRRDALPLPLPVALFLVLGLALLWAQPAHAQTGIGASGVFTEKEALGPDGVVPVSLEEFAHRRARLAEAVGDGVVLGMGTVAPPHDYIPFFQNASFRYLTGVTEPDAALLMEVAGGEVVSEVLLVNPRDPETETWEGYRMGPLGTREAAGLDGRSVGELAPALAEALERTGADQVLVVGPYAPGGTVRNDVTQRVDALLKGHPGVEARNASALTDRLREIKSDAEMDLLRMATAITSAAHLEVMSLVRPGLNEFEVQALLEHTFRRYGAERPAFASIVGSGPNSTILHYNTNDRHMEDGEVLLVDIGASYGGYAADITRTIPVNGRFSPEQREIYQLVLDAQRAAEEMAGPGVPVARLNAEAARVLEEGLVALGLVEEMGATYEDAAGRSRSQLTLFYMHGLGHGIGLDVHDPWPTVLEPGTAFTIEPGIYVRPNLFSEVLPDTPRNRELGEAIGEAFQRYVNIGVRIEDDYLVTEDGLEWLSPVPREIEEIEAFMAGDRSVPLPRRDDWVEWYRAGVGSAHESVQGSVHGGVEGHPGH